MIHRFSSRRQRLDHSFLRERLQGAQGYDRIAGFFSSSILEVAGEALESVTGTVRLVCNSGLDPQDVAVAQKAAQAAMRREWCAAEPERLPESARPRFQRLYDFLVSDKLRVKVIPDAHFGLIHGKAGVITLADGSQTAFLGSVNESLTAWRLIIVVIGELRRNASATGSRTSTTRSSLPSFISMFSVSTRIVARANTSDLSSSLNRSSAVRLQPEPEPETIIALAAVGKELLLPFRQAFPVWYRLGSVPRFLARAGGELLYAVVRVGHHGARVREVNARRIPHVHLQTRETGRQASGQSKRRGPCQAHRSSG